jgi:DNA polymerase
MVVGEAPGEQEDLQGQPFVGKSGQLLTQMLHAIGVDRQTDVFIANVVKCRPPGNRNPKPDEIAQCRPFLMRQIEVVAPQRLLVLGRYAAQVLVGAEVTLNALRGQIHTFTGSNGRRIPMIVSYHPAYLLRSPQEKAKAWLDLRLATKSIGPKATVD